MAFMQYRAPSLMLVFFCCGFVVLASNVQLIFRREENHGRVKLRDVAIVLLSMFFQIVPSRL